MRLNRPQLSALKAIAPRNGKGGGVPSVRIGATAEATDGRILLRLRLDHGLEPAVQLAAQTIRDASLLIEPDASCAILPPRGADDLPCVRMDDGSQLSARAVNHKFPDTTGVKRLAESAIAASIHLDPRLLRKVLTACLRVTDIVRLDMPEDCEQPIRLSWQGGEAFLAPVSVDGGEVGTPAIVEVALAADGSDIPAGERVDRETGEVTPAPGAREASPATEAIDASAKRPARKSRGGAR